MRLARFLILLIAVTLPAATAFLPAGARAAELLMYRRAGCSWCLAWDREIGPIYGRTEIGRRMPVRMIDLGRERPAVMLKGPIIYTPTFVLADEDREVSRIEGYPGQDFFWGLLEQHAQRLLP